MAFVVFGAADPHTGGRAGTAPFTVALGSLRAALEARCARRGRGSGFATRDDKQHHTADQGDDTQDGGHGNRVNSLGRDLDRSEIEGLLRDGVGDALVGQRDDTENDQDDGGERQRLHDVLYGSEYGERQLAQHRQPREARNPARTPKTTPATSVW